MRTEDGIVIGNVTDKGHLAGGIAGRLVARFDRNLLAAARGARPASVHEVGCGEGRVSRLLHAALTVPVAASDFSKTLIAENQRRGDAGIRYFNCSIYDLQPAEHAADLVVCCEVLEHVDEPERAVRALASLGAARYVLSVPHEPIWRILNMARGKYLGAFGNTPGHLNHWSRSSFGALLGRHGFVAERWWNPFPWLMVSGTFRRQA